MSSLVWSGASPVIRGTEFMAMHAVYTYGTREGSMTITWKTSVPHSFVLLDTGNIIDVCVSVEAAQRRAELHVESKQ